VRLTGYCALLALALGLGCAIEPPSTEPHHPVLKKTGDADRLLDYFARLHELPATELQREHQSALQDFAADKTDFNRVRLALVASMPYAPIKDYPAALALLEPLVRQNPKFDLSAFALLLSSLLTEQQRLEETAETLNQQVKEGQKRGEPLEHKLREEQRRAETLEFKLKEETKRSEALQQKLEALKAIEKSISEREQTK
jgi:tetratricopeptide (TPR) repeat protein